MNYLRLDILVKSAAATGVIVLGSALAVYKFQNALIYPANLPAGSRKSVDNPSMHGMPVYEELDLETPDKVKIKAFLILHSEIPNKKRPIIIVLHANAGNIGHRMPIVKILNVALGFDVLALSYRGYGLSEGVASEKGINLDAQTALDYVLSDPRTENADIFLYGQSIGGAVAIEVASKNSQRIKGVILENTFTSLKALVMILMPYLTPILCLLHQHWPSLERVSKYPKSLNVLFLSGARDTLIPPHQMKELFEKCTATKEFVSFKNGTHNDTCTQPDYFKTIGRFIDGLSTPPQLQVIDSEDKEIPSSMESSFEIVSKPVEVTEKLEKL